MTKKSLWVICIVFILFIMYAVMYYGSSPVQDLFLKKITLPLNDLNKEKYVLLTEGCKIRKYDPFDPTVLKYYSEKNETIYCLGKRYLDILDNKVVLLKKNIFHDFKTTHLTCTYKEILRNPKNDTIKADNKVGYGEEKLLKLGDTLPSEFVNVLCKIRGKVYEEFLAATPLKADVENRCKQNKSKLKSKKLNVIVIGIDSVSKLNFERHFKLTAEYIRKNLSFYEFHGYTKVADNTFPNLTPMLTGHFIKHYYRSSIKNRYFDDLDFIWKNYSTLGYRTFLAEDAPMMATFNYVKNGFQFPPTDYFFRPFTLAVEKGDFWKYSLNDCFQGKPEINVLFDYLRSFLTTMKSRPYFAFTWAARLTHNELNKAGYADKPTFDLMKDINEMGLLNSSMVVFMSDHGLRFGGILNTYIGKVEERMPFLFISLPRWFLKAYPEVAKHLNINQNRLTTPFDLHETLVDVYQRLSGDTEYKPTPYGISLLKEISPERTCKSAYIAPHWCVCQEYYEISNSDEVVIEAARLLIEKVNNLTALYGAQCAFLSIDTILDARSRKLTTNMGRFSDEKSSVAKTSVAPNKTDYSNTELLVTVRAKPGGAEFESTILVRKEGFEVHDISRMNMYGTQGDCISDSDLRKYCYCS